MMSEWISVEDRLPSLYADVIVFHGGFVELSTYYEEFDGHRCFDIDGCVTHWMPLPEPPESV